MQSSEIIEGNKPNPYVNAWKQFEQSAEYSRCVISMFKSGMKQPYIDNILRTAFDAGYNQTTKP